MVSEKAYVNIQAFMVNELHLSGNELIIYAVIYGFSQDGDSWFTGSRSYLAEWCQASKSTVSRNLEKLCQQGLIEKRTRIESGVTLNDYRAVGGTQNEQGVYPKCVGGVPKMNRGGVPKMSTHNIDINTKENKLEEKSARARFTPPSVEEVAAYCQERGNKVDPETFIDFYTAKGWKVGSQPMKDWKAAVRTWEKRRAGYSAPVYSGRRDPNDTTWQVKKPEDYEDWEW